MKTVAAGLEEYFSRSTLPILFAGAGVSAQAGLPTWSSYLTALGSAVAPYDQYTKYMIDKAVSEGALGAAAAYYMMCSDMPEATKLSELTKPLEVFQDEGLSGIVQLPFRSVVTTNFDRSLFSAYATHKSEI